MKKKSGAELKSFIPIEAAIKWVNHILIALVLAAGVYLGMDLTVLKPNRTSYLSQMSVHEAIYPLKAELDKKAPKELSYYRETADKRNPFLPPPAAPAPAEEKAPEGVPAPRTKKLNELLQGIKLVGISWEAEPLAMVEDARTARTYFLRKGQEVNGLKVRTITKEKVIFTCEGEEGELF